MNYVKGKEKSMGAKLSLYSILFQNVLCYLTNIVRCEVPCCIYFVFLSF